MIRDLRNAGHTLKRAARLGDRAGDCARLRDEIWQERLESVAATAKINLFRLRSKKSDSDKVLLAAVLKSTTDVSNRWLAERLAMGTPATAGEFVRRFLVRHRLSRRYQKLLLRIET